MSVIFMDLLSLFPIVNHLCMSKQNSLNSGDNSIMKYWVVANTMLCTLY